MFPKKKGSLALFLLTLFGVTLAPASLRAANITLTGTMAQDDTVQLFDVVVTAGRVVDFRSYGYGGGTTSTGQAIAPGGFDTVLNLFSGSEVLLTDNDDGAGVQVDPTTGQAYDARITTNLTPGNYILALTQYDNFANGPNLTNGFAEAGRPNFTANPSFTPGPPCPGGLFRDDSGTAGQCRTARLTMDFLNVQSATARLVVPVPEPTAAWLLGGGFALLALAMRRKKV